jgi:M6 family metalloprotease-like protein
MMSFRAVFRVSLLALGLAPGLVVGSAGALAAQQRRVEQLYTADGRVLDLPPDGGWRVKARRVAQLRAQLLSQGRVAGVNVPQANVVGGSMQGTMYIPTVLIAFKNTDTTVLPKKARYDSTYYGATPLVGHTYSVRTFYEEMSHGLFHVAGGTYGWVAADSSQSYYLDACGVGTNPFNCASGMRRADSLFVNVLGKLNASVNFGQYDNDGPDGVPNSGDDDGIVDVVQFVIPVVGRECGGPGYNAHRFYLAGLPGTGQYTTSSPRTGGGFIKIDSYILVSGIGGNTCTNTTQVQQIGTTSHELGHVLGLPDLYDTQLQSEGIGEWGIMSSGNYTSLNSPAHDDAWSLQQLGWVTARPLTTNGTYSAGPVETSDTVFSIRPLGTNPRGEYYLLENKRAVGSDSANLRTGGGTGPKIGGLLVWHVDSTKMATWPLSNAVNNGPIHGLELEQADGLGELDKSSGGNRGDAGDPYPGTTNNKRFSFDTNPANLKNSDGTFDGFAIDSVTRSVIDSTVSFKLSFGGPTIVRATDTLALVTVDATQYRRFAQLLTPSSTHQLDFVSPQLTADSLRQYLFVSWSDLGAQSHSFTAKLAGDSISATVTTRFRVRATASGSGTITPHPAGDVAAGIYVKKDSSIALKATPAAGKTFGGWSGDSSATADSLLITVSRPYTLVASFQDLLVASVGTPPGPVMGKSFSHPLTATGGSGSYSWQVIGGTLPDGLSLGAAGVISGIPTKAGSYTATARVTSAPQTASVTIALTVTVPALITADVVSQILGTRQPLSASDLKYLDLIGNNDGEFDVGDFLAWVQATGAPAPPIAPSVAARRKP